MILLKRKIEDWTSDELRDVIILETHSEIIRRRSLPALESRRYLEGWRGGHDEGYEDGQRVF